MYPSRKDACLQVRYIPEEVRTYLICSTGGFGSVFAESCQIALCYEVNYHFSPGPQSARIKTTSRRTAEKQMSGTPGTPVYRDTKLR